ncbi:MAG TPA: hypothetical protein VHR66_24295 [Gemmataceae bacterium]|nr:hypothetical protein [Gemmataceae bacterium]
MARTIEEIVREQTEIRDEHDRLCQEAEEAEAAGTVGTSDQGKTISVLDDLDLGSVNADELERWVDRFHEDQNITEAWLAQQAKLNSSLATQDQQAAKIEDLTDDKGRLEVDLDQAKGMNSGLRNENENLRHKLGLK